MLDTIVDYLDSMGAGGLFIAVFIEALGLPFPGGIMVILAGVMCSQGKISLLTVFGITVTGFTLGASVSFYLGKHVGEPVIDRYAKYLHITPQSFHKAQEWMERSAAVFILAGRFIPMVSNLTPYMAGISKLSWNRFLFYNSIFAITWSGFNILIGIAFGHNWKQLVTHTRSTFPVIAIIILVLYFFWKFRLFKYFRRKKAPNWY